MNGRNTITWEDKFKLDVWYVDHMSFWLDIRILAVTVWKILKREGITQPGHATAEEFMGSHAKALSRFLKKSFTAFYAPRRMLHKGHGNPCSANHKALSLPDVPWRLCAFA